MLAVKGILSVGVREASVDILSSVAMEGFTEKVTSE